MDINTSAGESMSVGGWAAVGLAILAFLSALVKSVRWIANFSDEHEEFKRHLKRSEPMALRFPLLEQDVLRMAEERKELLTEVRGLRADIMRILGHPDG